MSTLLLLAVALPWVAAALVLALRGRPRLGERLSVVAGLVLLAAVGMLVPVGLDGGTTVELATVVSDIGLAFRADAAGVFFALVVSALWPAASVYSAGYLDVTGATSRARFGACFAASIGAVLGIAFAANLLTLFVFYELLTVATFPLVVHKETEPAREAGRKYAAYAMGGGVAVLAGTVLVYAAAGSVSFTPGGIGALATADPLLAQAAFTLLVVGFGVKAALMPLHGWLPDAMVAPTPVSGLLHAVAVVKSGVFGIARVVLYVFGPEQVQNLGVGLPLAVVAAVTMTVAGLVALKQERLKRGLAYSTVSQLSYIVLGLAVLTPTAVHGAFLHLAAHAFMKIVLFFSAGIIYVETHVETIADLRGIGRRLPLTMTAFGVASAGLVGLPFVAGFVSKWYLLTGLFEGGRLLLAATLLAASLLKLLFFWPLLSAAFFAEPAPAGEHDEHPAAHSPYPDGGERDGHGEENETDRGGKEHETDHGGKEHETDHGSEVHVVGRGEWESRSWRTETRWVLLVPVLLAVLVAVVFGVVPTDLPFYDLAARVVEVTT